MNKSHKKIVCLGGGIGTVNLVKGLNSYFSDIAVVLSMADDGGSAGRLRRLYNIPPTGDLVSNMAAFISESQPKLAQLLTYRFPGQRYGKDSDLEGHKLGNLILTALIEITGSIDKAIIEFQKIFTIPGTFLPATDDLVSLSAVTTEGKEIIGEETIDLGSFEGKKEYDKVFLHPRNVQTTEIVIQKLKEADIIIGGPGDLFSTVLPVCIIQDISKILKTSTAHKAFIVNVTNQPEETNNYTVSDYIKAIERNVGFFPFDSIIVNNNFTIPLPKDAHNQYVQIDIPESFTKKVIQGDLVDEYYPLYHDSRKLAKIVSETL